MNSSAMERYIPGTFNSSFFILIFSLKISSFRDVKPGRHNF